MFCNSPLRYGQITDFTVLNKLLKTLITHAPSRETIAKELLVELRKCRNTLIETLGVLLR